MTGEGWPRKSCATAGSSSAPTSSGGSSTARKVSHDGLVTVDRGVVASEPRPDRSPQRWPSGTGASWADGLITVNQHGAATVRALEAYRSRVAGAQSGSSST